jgi:hypothetical protein
MAMENFMFVAYAVVYTTQWNRIKYRGQSLVQGRDDAKICLHLFFFVAATFLIRLFTRGFSAL